MRECPDCGGDVEYEEPDPSTGIIGGFYCTACDWVDEDGTAFDDESDYADAERKIQNGG